MPQGLNLAGAEADAESRAKDETSSEAAPAPEENSGEQGAPSTRLESPSSEVVEERGSLDQRLAGLVEEVLCVLLDLFEILHFQ